MSCVLEDSFSCYIENGLKLASVRQEEIKRLFHGSGER